MTTNLHIIDTIGPFFVGETKNDTINWSKVPFSQIESAGRLSSYTQSSIVKNFETYIKKVSAIGYDAISIDDLAHMANMPFYSPPVQKLIDDYQALYKQLFTIAKHYGMRIYVNTDYLFTNNEIEQQLQSQSAAELFKAILKKAFATFPEIDGVILRIGENDGKDVSGTFLSKLFLRTPKQANELLKSLLPLFESYDKQLIFRTWTVGAYKIGDLIWNTRTYDKVFSDITSNALIVSMKFGDTDFMRYLALNPLFFHGSHRKIIELQTRREWEGMGMYPSFVGWDYEKYLRKLLPLESFVGIHVWCQTGGWAKNTWYNLTYLQKSSIWNELNTEVTVAIAQGHTVEDAVKTFCTEHGINNAMKFTKLLKHSETAVKKGLYIADIARQTLYFRRTRIPPLLWVTWDTFYLPDLAITLHRLLIRDQATVLKDGESAIEACEAMITIAHNLQLGANYTASLQFERDTMLVLMKMRHYIVSSLIEVDKQEANNFIHYYARSYPEHYTIPKIKKIPMTKRLSNVIPVFIRRSKTYRKRDLVLLRTSGLQKKFVSFYLKKSRSRLADQSMGFETLFK